MLLLPYQPHHSTTTIPIILWFYLFIFLSLLIIVSLLLFFILQLCHFPHHPMYIKTPPLLSHDTNKILIVQFHPNFIASLHTCILSCDSITVYIVPHLFHHIHFSMSLPLTLLYHYSAENYIITWLLHHINWPTSLPPSSFYPPSPLYSASAIMYILAPPPLYPLLPVLPCDCFHFLFLWRHIHYPVNLMPSSSPLHQHICLWHPCYFNNFISITPEMTLSHPFHILHTPPPFHVLFSGHILCYLRLLCVYPIHFNWHNTRFLLHPWFYYLWMFLYIPIFSFYSVNLNLGCLFCNLPQCFNFSDCYSK